MEILKSFFRFTSRERLAILILCLLMVLFWTLPLFFPEKPPKFSLVQSKGEKIADSGHSNQFNQEDAGNNTNIAHEAVPEGFARTPRKAHYFFFDPNTIGVEQWRELGLRDKTILTIQHYLQKGGRFRQPQDLRKIWGLKPSEADLLIPYIQIPSTITPSKKRDSGGKSASSHFDLTNPASLDNQTVRNPLQTISNTHTQVADNTPPVYQRKSWDIQPIDINQAGIEQWMAFPGIGEVLAARIVKYRDRMGGFTSIEQVSKTYGIKDSLFQLMKPFLTLGKTAEKK